MWTGLVRRSVQLSCDRMSPFGLVIDDDDDNDDGDDDYEDEY